MEMGIVLPHVGRAASPKAIRQVATTAEELGIDHLWAGDHIVLPLTQKTAYPYGDTTSYPVPSDRNFYECFLTLSYAAACTSGVKIGAGVCIMPYRNPVILAKMVGTLDSLAEGRAILGVGQGWLHEEFDALGVNFEQRGPITREYVDFLGAIWRTDQAVSYHGQWIDIDDMYIAPSAFKRRSIPLWFGGNGPRSRSQALSSGGVWMPMLKDVSPEYLSGLRKEEGGLPQVALFAALGDESPGRPPWESGVFSKNAVVLERELREYSDAGVEAVVFTIGGHTEKRLDALKMLSEVRSAL